MTINVLLISTYEMGRQPFGLASPAAWLREAGVTVTCIDLAVDPFPEAAARAAHLVAFYVPMHTATRLAVDALARLRAINPTAHVCFYGLYAPENADYLRGLGVDTLIGGEFEAGLVALARNLAGGCATNDIPLISLDRQTFHVPDRAGLPALDRYAKLQLGNGEECIVGYVEATRGCKHLCRHCPIVPVYNGRFRLVQRDVVLADIRQQVAAGAQHITFGDPDFFNGPGHAAPIIEALHAEWPSLTYDVTIKVEHLLKHAELLPSLKRTGCLFITSAVEAFDERILAIFDKQHTRQEFETVLRLCDAAGVQIIPTFVAFTPWTTLDGYRDFLAEIARLGLVERVAPVQYAIRLLIPPGSRLLELAETRAVIDGLDQARLSYTWRNPDPRVDALQRDLERLAQSPIGRRLSRPAFFERVWARTYQDTPDHALATMAVEAAATPPPPPLPPMPLTAAPVPRLSEPWFC